MYLVTVLNEDGAWKYGTVNGSKITFEAKVFEEPSENAIDEGHIVKLFVRKKSFFGRQKELFAYDRGWDFGPDTPEEKEILNAIVQFFNTPENCRLDSLSYTKKD